MATDPPEAHVGTVRHHDFTRLEAWVVRCFFAPVAVLGVVATVTSETAGQAVFAVLAMVLLPCALVALPSLVWTDVSDDAVVRRGLRVERVAIDDITEVHVGHRRRGAIKVGRSTGRPMWLTSARSRSGKLLLADLNSRLARSDRPHRAR